MNENKKFVVVDLQTGGLADTEGIALHEEWAKGLIYCDMEQFTLGEDGTLYLLDECGHYEECPKGRFKIVWLE